ncbi:MAG: phospholipid/cholesterol/gamma-HCH transport system ATP-binding protein [Flavobacteriales bacterium]|jgi:phospholipid/cholesterol/gamma-HCH transport system ATP-binding protein
MIRVKNISKSFNGTQVLTDVSFDFLKGKTNLIIGQSGSGKSVLNKCMVGLYEADEGEIWYEGFNLTQAEKKEKRNLRKEIGMLFQGSALFDSLTVEENVMFPLDMFSDMSIEEKLDRANFCLTRVNLDDKNHMYPSELSGGMQKRVGIARAIALNPNYLFCDEPNSGLDPKTSIVIDNLIKDITEEYDITTVIITHDMNSVLEIGENICFIHEGQKWWEGNKEDILIAENKELVDFVYASDLMRRLKK